MKVRGGRPGVNRSAAAELRAGALDADREVDVLAAARDENADDAPLLVEGGAAGVARVRGRVGLDLLAGHAADDSGRDRAGQSEWAADEQKLVAGACVGALPGVLPERRRARRLAGDADDGEVVVGVGADDLAAPRAALARDRDDRARGAGDDVVRRHQVAVVAVAPGHEAGPEGAVGLDGEDAL